ncbi:uncharacterized protein LOC126898516 isoform X2 [Daktulosphaira vitifoliae]|nr:uncharacterized protein LOC126898516 isoform X2 [Daktulosphaira vitifoliae]
MPTPNTFIKHCEDVGLFQELQKVNPFDETFKKAVECKEIVGYTVKSTNSNSNELNTPFIVPITATLKNRLSFPSIVVDNHNEESILIAQGEKIISETVPNLNVVLPTELSCDTKSSENFSVPQFKLTPTSLNIGECITLQKIDNAIKLPKILPLVTSQGSEVVSMSIQNMLPIKQVLKQNIIKKHGDIVINTKVTKKIVESDSSVLDTQKKMLLERNRSAAKRSRQKRKAKIEQLVSDNQKLKRQNIMLQNILVEIISKNKNISVKIPSGLITIPIR